MGEGRAGAARATAPPLLHDYGPRRGDGAPSLRRALNATRCRPDAGDNMNIDPQFPWWILADAAGGVLTLVVCAAFTPVIRHIVRRLTSVLPKTPDTERVQEELEGLVDEMSSEERIELAASLLLNITRLRDELAGQTAEI